MEKDRRNKKKKLKKKRIRRNPILVLLFILIILIVIGLIAGYELFYKMTGVTIYECYKESKEVVMNSNEKDFMPKSNTVIYSASKKKIAELSDNERTASYLTYDDIPDAVVDAFVVSEDQTFWTNSGYDLKGIARAFYNVVQTKSASQGGSTITQQLVKNVYLTNEKSIERKVRELFLSYYVNKVYSKEEIMEYYVNNICFANNIYGIQDAAKNYFGKSAEDLSLSEMVYLCSIPNSPEYYDPWKNSENTVKRRDRILDEMLEAGFITKSECEEAKAEEIKVKEKKKDSTGDYNYEVTYAIYCATEQIMKYNGFEFQYEFETTGDYEEYKSEYDEAYQEAKEELYDGGYTVYTTIDTDVQDDLQDILDDKLSDYNNEKSSDGTYNVQGAMTVIDNESGKVVGIIGGRSDDTGGVYTLNRAYQSPRQPGSSIKPLIVYTPGIELGMTKDTTLTDVDLEEAYETFKEGGSIKSLSGTKMSLEKAVWNSINGCSVYVFSQVGIDTGIGKLTDMRFSKILGSDHVISAAVGGFTYGCTTLEMANGYSTLSNDGVYTHADCIKSIMNDGEEIYDNFDSEQVYDSYAAQEMTEVLAGVAKYGTMKSVGWDESKYGDVHVKTGTTNDSKDGWLCGYTDDYSISVWVGRDDSKALDSLSGGTTPARIFRAAMEYMLNND